MPEFSRITGDIIALAAHHISISLHSETYSIPGAEDDLVGVNDMLAASILELNPSCNYIAAVPVV